MKGEEERGWDENREKKGAGVIRKGSPVRGGRGRKGDRRDGRER